MKCKVRVKWYGLMVIHMKDNLLKDLKKAMEYLNSEMETIMKVILEKIWCMDMGYINGKVENNMMENFMKVKCMEWVQSYFIITN